VIFVGTSAAWMILGVTITARTEGSDAALRGTVESVWGSPQIQAAPTAVSGVELFRPTATDVDGNIQLEYRQKGLLWYSTYRVAFRGDYDFANDSSTPRQLQITWKFPAKKANYDTLQFAMNGQPVNPTLSPDAALIPMTIGPGGKAQLRVTYRSQGLDSWKYQFGDQISSVPNFQCAVALLPCSNPASANRKAPTQTAPRRRTVIPILLSQDNRDASRKFRVPTPQTSRAESNSPLTSRRRPCARKVSSPASP